MSDLLVTPTPRAALPKAVRQAPPKQDQHRLAGPAKRSSSRSSPRKSQHDPLNSTGDRMDWQRFDWPAMSGEPDSDWFEYLEHRGWTVSPVPTVARIGSRSYLRYLGWRARSA